MTGTYLDEATKEIYQKDFEENVLACEGSWRIPDDLRPFLKRINARPEMVTLFSKMGEKFDEWGVENKKSYLHLAYSESIKEYIEKHLELKLKELLNENEFNKELEFELRHPIKREKESRNCDWNCQRGECRMMYITEPKYLFLNYVAIEYHNTWSKELHFKFWEVLTETLEEL